MRAKKCISILFLVCLLTSCHRKQEGPLPLIEGDKPIYVCGGDSSGRYYKSIWKYIVDKKGKVYLWDSVSPYHIDVYDENGSFLRQIGRRGQGPSEFQAISAGAVDSKGNIWINEWNQPRLKVISNLGEEVKDIRIPENVECPNISKIIIDEDRLYIMGNADRGKVSIYKYDLPGDRWELIYREERRIKVSFVSFNPDLALDERGNLYITDSFDYRVHEYTKDGRLQVRYEDKRAKREPIVEKDFNIFDNDFKIFRYPEYEVIEKQLTGASRYFPVIFGINIDGGKVFIWTSERDNTGRYLVDIFDMGFNKIGKTSYFNLIRDNLARISGGKLYIPSIENYQVDLVRNLGRLSLTNIPDHLNVYKISQEILRR
ncbi:MAG: 6-bladed beta-propeller [Nitrososphaerota archaeon]